MKLYLLSQNTNSGYDTYDSCVVCAENEEDAKTILPDGGIFGDNQYQGWWWVEDINLVRCVEIGTANEDQERGVIIESFNAG